MAKDKSIELPTPRENYRLFGHEVAEQQFQREFAAGKTHHAYLMTGPKGIGKATLAYRFARHILATGAVHKKKAEAGPSLFGDSLPPLAGGVGGGSTGLFSGVDTSPTRSPTQPPPQAGEELKHDAMFRRIAAGSHTDLLSISPAYDKKKDAEKSIISVEEARKVPEFLSLTPAEGDWRVVIVDAIDQLNANAANALLKILEEPPASAILLLVCHAPGAILPTIKSRCRKFMLNAPARADFDKALEAVAPSIDRSDYGSLYGLSGGSPGLAITLYTHDGLKLYQQWLAALQPDAEPSARQRFIDLAAQQKTPDAWRTLLHGWQMAMHRIALWPQPAGAPIIGGEGELIGTIARAWPDSIRQQWAARATRLISSNDVFNLDKKQTIAMLLDPGLLDRLAA